MDQKAFFALSCGLYVVSAVHEGTARGCVVNTVQQVTSSPAQLSVTVNKENATAAWIAASGRFCAAVLTQSVPMNTIAVFGFSSSRDTDKFAAVAHKTAPSGAPYPAQGVASVFDCRVVKTLDVGTHIIFVGEAEDAFTESADEPMTYAYYHKVKKGTTPPKASSYQPPEEKAAGWRCSVCGYVYEGEELPDPFTCPVCGQPREVFVKL